MLRYLFYNLTFKLFGWVFRNPRARKAAAIGCAGMVVFGIVMAIVAAASQWVSSDPAAPFILGGVAVAIVGIVVAMVLLRRRARIPSPTGTGAAQNVSTSGVLPAGWPSGDQTALPPAGSTSGPAALPPAEDFQIHILDQPDKAVAPPTSPFGESAPADKDLLDQIIIRGEDQDGRQS